VVIKYKLVDQKYEKGDTEDISKKHCKRRCVMSERIEQ
jgi:hypothetical protein